MAAQLAEDGVRVNCIALGYVDTEMISVVQPELRERCIESVPLGRMTEPAEVAGTIKYLLSDAASLITGEIININGGTFLP